MRDLLVAPRRFKELLAGLQGIGANLLATRLQYLQQQAIVEKVSGSGDNSSRYALTDKGQELEPVIVAMASWGLQHLRQGSRGKLNRPDLLVLAFRGAYNMERAADISESCEFRIDETIFWVELDQGKLTTGLGVASNPAFVFNTDAGTFDRIVDGFIEVSEAQERGLLNIIGDREALQRFLLVFNIEKLRIDKLGVDRIRIDGAKAKN